MYIVKRPFKNFGIVYTAGTVITDPAEIKRFKGKLAEGKIIEVTEQTLESTKAYFMAKFGVEITKPATTNKPVDPPAALRQTVIPTAQPKVATIVK